MIRQWLEKLALWYYTKKSKMPVSCLPLLDATVYYVTDLTPNWAVGQTIGTYIFVKARITFGSPDMMHEYAHVEQWKKHGALGFLFLYYGAFLINLIRYRNVTEAYMNVPFEKEAYLVNRPNG